VTEIYTGEGQTRLKQAAEKQLRTEFAESGLILEAVQVRNVELPSEYAQAVEQKEITEQRRQQKQSELEVEELEAQRKRIEASGEAEANRIVSRSLDQRVLAQKYLDTLDETDTVYIPVGEGGYPQFVQNIDAERTQPPRNTTANASAST
jgi:regulator of protease activity HflC (stomatin/prohibitin superfamily)